MSVVTDMILIEFDSVGNEEDDEDGFRTIVGVVR